MWNWGVAQLVIKMITWTLIINQIFIAYLRVQLVLLPWLAKIRNYLLSTFECYNEDVISDVLNTDMMNWLWNDKYTLLWHWSWNGPWNRGAIRVFSHTKLFMESKGLWPPEQVEFGDEQQEMRISPLLSNPWPMLASALVYQVFGGIQ